MGPKGEVFSLSRTRPAQPSALNVERRGPPNMSVHQSERQSCQDVQLEQEQIFWAVPDVGSNHAGNVALSSLEQAGCRTRERIRSVRRSQLKIVHDVNRKDWNHCDFAGCSWIVGARNEGHEASVDARRRDSTAGPKGAAREAGAAGPVSTPAICTNLLDFPAKRKEYCNAQLWWCGDIQDSGQDSMTGATAWACGWLARRYFELSRADMLRIYYNSVLSKPDA